MGIRIKPEPDIEITQEEHDRYHQEWLKANQYTTMPVSFETFVRNKKAKENG